MESVTHYAIYMLPPAGIITNWNEGARRIKRLRFDEVEGSHFSRCYTQEDRHAGMPDNALRMALDEGRFEHEGWRVRGDGSTFWAHVVIEPARNSDGELVGFAKITRAITERRDTNLALERAKEALHQAQKLEAVGKLTGGIAKTPVGPVITDTAQFESALLNLVINARDAIGEHGHIVIKTAQVGALDQINADIPAGNYVVVSVRANGSGMTPEVQARVLEPLFTTKPIGTGTGPGLSQVYGLMQQTGGYLDIQSSCRA